jgi:hypothetical protein
MRMAMAQPKGSMMAVTTQIRRDLAQPKGSMTAVTTPMAMTLLVMGKAHESW